MSYTSPAITAAAAIIAAAAGIAAGAPAWASALIFLAGVAAGISLHDTRALL